MPTLDTSAALSVREPLPASGDGFTLPEDGWFHLASLGEFPHDSGIIQVIDPVAVARMVDAFHREMPGGFPGLLLDYEHFSHDPKGSTAAAGWITDLESRADGLWGMIRWSDEGQQAVAGGRYRFVSPTWLQGDCESLPGNRLRPGKLYDVTLTNRPNLTGLTPLSHRRPGIGAAAEAERLTNAQKSDRQQEAVANVRRANPGFTFSQAWEKAKEANPNLFTVAADGGETMANAAPAPEARPSIAAQVVAAQQDAVSRIRRANPEFNFTRAWQEASRENPDLFS